MSRNIVRKVNTRTTQARAQECLDLAAKGHSLSEIATALGMTRGAVSGVIHRKRAPLREPTNGAVQPRYGHGHMEGQSLIDPNRADKLLRRFSWQEPAE